MRITNSMMTANALQNINKAANRLANANEQQSSQQKIQLASDDPVVAARAVTYRSYVSKISQYQDNVDAATGWQEATDSALGELSDVIQNVQELTTQAASDTLNDTDREGIKSNIQTLRDQAISIMNSTYAGRYIFGGYSTSEAPYESISTTIGESVTFKGDYLSLGGVVSADIDDADIESFYTANASDRYQSTTEQNINYNIGFSSEVTVNIEGQDVIGEGTGSNFFDTLDKLILALDGDTTYKTASLDSSGNVTVITNTLAISDLLSDLATDYTRMLVPQATLGARMDKVSSVSDSLGDAYTTYKTLMSENEDVDLTESTTEQTSAQYTYEAALTVGSKVISKTLIDYIG